ncbi:hypothetical protein GQ53DRAFT_837506 [Thozetella sp. PMI_491]|nr:hypothetical protein GQ53DRAFT_837506 [Thozetella sp. PMI_491]
MAPVVHRFGLTELYRPPESIICKADIFFVHGLFGHPKETWTCHVKPEKAEDALEDAPAKKKNRWIIHPEDQEVFWPRDLLPKILAHVRIFTWGYDVQVQNLFSSASKATVFQHAETLLLDVASVRTTPSERSRPIIFAAHSLGGIVVKEALCVSQNESTFLKDILPVTTGVCFLGTPHKGSKIASIGKIAFSMARALALQDPNLKILRALEVQSDVLERIGRNFAQILGQGKLKVHSFREELKTKGMLVVDAVSATLDHFAETRGSIHANHRDIVRFGSMDDVGFRRITAVFSNWVQEDISVAESGQLESLGPSGYSGYRQRLAMLTDEELIDGCLANLDRTEARERINNVDDRLEGTYDWLFEERVQFKDWLRNKIPGPLFWINGKPGSGKSTMMKLALRHLETQKFLGECHSDPWVVAGFFFHDRGSGVQKSLEGLLREILYQILQQQPRHVRLLLESQSSSLVFKEKGEGISFSVNWNPQELELALLSLASNHKLNLCLFIDALDEHHGNHQLLVNFIQKLSHLPDARALKLKICLASRPENLFNQKFKDMPGFAIHRYTHEDIKKYTSAGLSDIAEEAADGFDSLVRDVLEKARGVFLWVKLVVAELVENWLSGDTVDELRHTLSEIPEELQDLYQRTLQRGRLQNTRSVQKGRLEAYIMFQIAQYNPPGLSMGKFTKLVQYNIMGDEFRDGQFTEPQMRRRINDRSSGLLEVLQDAQERTSVQFIHQTTNEYFLCDKGYRDLYDDAVDRPIETGLIYFIRATVWLRALDGSFYAPEIMVIETRHRLPAISQFDASFARRIMTSKIIRWAVPLAFVRAVRAVDDVDLSKIFIAIVFSFDLSLEEALGAGSSIARQHGGILLRATAAMLIAKSKSDSPSEVLSAVRCLKALLKSGITATDKFEERTCEQDLQESEIRELHKVQGLEALYPISLPNSIRGAEEPVHEKINALDSYLS